MAMTFEQYVNDKKKREPSAEKITFDQYVRQPNTQPTGSRISYVSQPDTQPESDPLMALAMETVQAEPFQPYDPSKRFSFLDREDNTAAPVNTGVGTAAPGTPGGGGRGSYVPDDFRGAKSWADYVIDAAKGQRDAYADMVAPDNSPVGIQRRETNRAFRTANAFMPLENQPPEAWDTYNKLYDEAVEEDRKLKEMGGRAARELPVTLPRSFAAGTLGAVRGLVNEAGYIAQGATKAQMDENAEMWRRMGREDYAQDMEAVKDAQGGFQNWANFGQNYISSAAEAAAGYGKTGQALSNVAQGVGGMVPSIVSNLAVPGSGLPVMFFQASGNATEEAKAAGASDEAAAMYGTAVGAVEVLTEKMFGGIPGLNIGALDDALEAAVKRGVGSEAAQRAILFLINALGEGVEEFTSEFGDYFLDKWLLKNDERTRGDVWKDAMYSFLIGALTSVAMQAPVEVANMAKTPQGRKQLAQIVADQVDRQMATAQTVAPQAEAQAEELPSPSGNLPQYQPIPQQTGNEQINETLMRMAQEVSQEQTAQPMTQRQTLDMVLNENANMGDTGKKYARELFRLTQGENGNALDFYRSFDAVYQAARRGETAADVMSQYGDALTPQAAQAAFNAGVEDMAAAMPQTAPQQAGERYTYTVEQNDGGRYAVTVRDAQNGSEYSGGVYDTQAEADQVVNDFKKQMEGVTVNVKSGAENADGGARVPEREGRGGVRGRAEAASEWRAARQRAAEDIRNSVFAAEDGEEVSNREAGISGGTDEKSMRLVRKYENDETRWITADAAKKGVNVVFFLGEIRAMKGGKKIAARGEYSADGKTFYIALDDPDFTARQIYDHEDFHERSHSDAKLQEIAENIINSHSAAELQEMVAAYVNAYGWTDMSNEDIIQEILADAYAGIDIFMGRDVFEGATRFTEDVRGAVKTREGEQQQTRGPPSEAKLSEKLTHDSEGRELTPESYAPTFYSKLEQEIENFKGDKLGAGSVVSYLRGRGVKADEIKWSGIETFLDGKKSVSKSELQNWLRDNRLEIETETLADENGGLIEYTDEERRDLDVMHMEKEKLLDRSVELWNEAYDEAIPNRIILADKVDDAITLEIINRHGGRTGFDGIESLNKAERELWDKVTDGIRRLDYQIERIVDRAKARQKNTRKTKWSDYKQEGGENYREYLFRIPGSDYTNRAMYTHWDGKRGVLAHARVQDFTSGGQPVMFVEEIQSDWHNAGQKNGYYTGSAAAQEKKAKAIQNEAIELAHDLSNRAADISSVVRKAQSAINETATFPWTYQKTYGVLVRHSVNDPDYETAMSALSKDEQENIIRYREDYEYWAVRDEEADRAADAAPDAPYSKTYHEFVLKSLLRMAAEGDYDYLAWTPGWMQAERWSEQYSKGYEIEYDQDIPKFLRKYGKQWGARVTEIGLDGLSNVTVPAIEVNDAMRDSVLYEGQPQFSQKLTTEDELRRQNEDLKQRVEYWKGQTKRTTVPTARADDAVKVARQIVKDYDSEADAKEIGAALKDLTDYIMRGENITYAEVKDRAVEIAREVVENAKALRDGDGETFREVRDALQKPLIISAQDAHDVTPDGWGDFRNSIRSKVNISINGKGTPIDTAYAELSDRFPSLFPAEITHPADQLQHMVDVIDELTPVYDNPFSYNMAEAIEYSANDIINRVFGDDIRMNPPTFADKAAAKLAAEKARGAERVAEVREQKNVQIADLKARNAWATAQRIAEVKKQRDAQLAALKEHYAEAKKTASEKKADSAARTRLLKIAKRLQNKKLPAVSRALLEQYIGNLDTVAKSITGNTVMDLSRLRSWYDDQKANNPDFIADAATEAKIARLSKTQISDMTPTQVAELTEVLLNFENEINTRRRMIDSEDKRDTRQMVLESLYNVEETKGSKKNAADWLVTNTLSPERLIKRLTGYAETDPLLMRTRELADGQRRMLDYQMRAEAKFKRWANDKKLMERLRSKERIKITGYYNGRAVEVEITPDMRMALYLHSLNDQNMKHIAKGGVTIPDIDTYLKGDIGEAYTRGTTVKLSPSNIRTIAAGMSAEERAYAKAAHDYFNGMSKDEVNATSEKLVGYSIAGVDDYFPIETDRNFTKSDIAELKRDGTIEGMGFLKERVNASNAIYLVPLTDVLNKSIKNHAKYVGLAIPVRNFSKVWGMNAHNDAASEDNGLRKAIGKKWGERGVDAIETMIADLQNSYHKADELDKMFSKIKSNYAGAVLTLNLSVAMKQAASYPTAAAVLGWGPVAKAMKDVGRVDLDQIAKFTPLQWYRSQGYSTQELGDIRSRGGLMDRVLGTTVRVKGRDVPLFNWIQTADLLTTRKLWKASEYYVQQHNADLRRGSEEYYTAVAGIYNRVIEETQPNYTTMQRPQLLRSHSAWAEILGMFKTQPFQNFNILYDATAELAAAERAAKNGDKSRLAAARQNAKNAYTSQVASLALFAAMTAAYGFLRGRDDKWRNKEGEVTVGSVAAGIGRDMIGGLFSMVPGGSDVYNLGEAMATGGKYYGVSSVTVSALTDAGTAIYKAGTAISKAIEQANDPEKEVNVKALLKSMETLTLELSKALGVPAENIRNDVQIIMKTALNDAFGYYAGSYIMTRYTENMDSSYTKGDVYDLLYSAYRHDRSAYNELRRMMKEDGFTDKNMDAAIKKRSEKK